VKKPKTKKPIPAPGEDALALGDAIVALVIGGGRGALSDMAAILDMTPSALAKRLQRPGAGMDEATMRAVIHVSNTRADRHEGKPVVSTQHIGNFIIEVREDGTVTWKAGSPNDGTQVRHGQEDAQ
jgi:hypothetical protein